RDSNPRRLPSTVFKTATFGRSVNPPGPHCGASSESSAPRRTLADMRAMVIEETGGADGRATLTAAEVPTPAPGPGQVAIEVAAAGVNRADLLQLKGLHPPPAGAPAWPGLEVSGRVTAVGEGVDPAL